MHFQCSSREKTLFCCVVLFCNIISTNKTSNGWDNVVQIRRDFFTHWISSYLQPLSSKICTWVHNWMETLALKWLLLFEKHISALLSSYSMVNKFLKYAWRQALKRCTWHRKASAKNSSKLNKFLHSEVNLLIQHIIEQDQDGQNNIIPKIVFDWK